MTEDKTIKKSAFGFIKETNWLERIMILAVVGYFIYLNQSTALVPNFNNQTNSVYYSPTSFVPKSNVSNSQTFFGVVLFILCILVLLQKRLATAKRATYKEAIEDLDKQLKEVRQIKLFNGKVIVVDDNIQINNTGQFMTRYRQTGEERKEFRYTFLVIVKDKLNNLPYYFRAWYEPWSRYLDGFYESNSQLNDKDRCPNCGNEHDIEYIMSSELRKYLELKKGLTPRL